MSLKQNDIWGENLLDTKIGTFHGAIPDDNCVCPLCKYSRQNKIVHHSSGYLYCATCKKLKDGEIFT